LIDADTERDGAMIVKRKPSRFWTEILEIEPGEAPRSAKPPSKFHTV
jgi:hypothetical protein